MSSVYSIDKSRVWSRFTSSRLIHRHQLEAENSDTDNHTYSETAQCSTGVMRKALWLWSPIRPWRRTQGARHMRRTTWRSGDIGWCRRSRWPGCERRRCTDQRLFGGLCQQLLASATTDRNRFRRRGWLFWSSPGSNEWVAHRSLWLDPSFGIPDETFRNEVHELFIITTQNLCKCLRPWSPSTTFWIDHCSWWAVGIYRMRDETKRWRGVWGLVPKNNFLRELRLTYSFSGIPSTSMIQDSCSCSFSPGKIGNPVYNSARMQPKLHISMAMW